MWLHVFTVHAFLLSVPACGRDSTALARSSVDQCGGCADEAVSLSSVSLRVTKSARSLCGRHGTVSLLHALRARPRGVEVLNEAQ